MIQLVSMTTPVALAPCPGPLDPDVLCDSNPRLVVYVFHEGGFLAVDRDQLGMSAEEVRALRESELPPHRVEELRDRLEIHARFLGHTDCGGRA